MKIEVINKKRSELSTVMEVPDGYTVPEGRQVMESQNFRKGKDFYEERKCIQLDWVSINFFKKSWSHHQEISVRSDGPYIQMHFELSGGAAYYRHNDAGFAVPTAQGEFSLFYMPQLDGTLTDPPCSNATSLEVELSQAWLLEHLGSSPATASDFMEDITASRPTLLGGKCHNITSFIFHTIDSLYNCPYTGNIKRLYTEGKLLELLALQLQQANTAGATPRRHLLSKQDVEHLHFLKEKITADPSKSYTIQELSYLTFMNRTKMQEGFRELFGCTIHRFIVENRMTEAYRLLTGDYSGHWNISEIARRVGYRYYNHFSMAFKKRFGVPPSRFLKKQQSPD